MSSKNDILSAIPDNISGVSILDLMDCRVKTMLTEMPKAERMEFQSLI